MTRIFLRTLALGLALLSMPAWSAETVTPGKLAGQLESGKAPLIIDVRTESEYLDGHVPEARLIPHDKMGGYIDSLSEHKEDPVVIYCGSGKRTQQAMERLDEAGFDQLIELKGHFPAWKEGGHPVEP